MMNCFGSHPVWKIEAGKKNRTFSIDIAREICTYSFYTVNSGLPCIAVTAVISDISYNIISKYHSLSTQIKNL